MRALLLILAVFFSLPSFATSYSAAADFSPSSNPNGAWSYGWMASLGQPFQLFSTHVPPNSEMSPDIKARLWSVNNDGLPAVFHNNTGISRDFLSVRVAPGALVMHPGRNGEVAILRWIAPAAGLYAVSAKFGGADIGVGVTDAHVLKNGVGLFQGTVNALDPQLSAPKAWTGELTLAAGDTLDFAVGDGGNGPSSDSTRLEATVVACPGGVCSTPSAGLVGYWSFNDCTATDSSGTGNSGTLVGSPACVAGKSGSGLQLNSTNYAQIPDSASLDLTTAFTISTWFKANAFTSSSWRLVDKVTAGMSDGFMLAVHSSGISLSVAPNAGLNLLVPISSDVFHHVAATFSQGMVQFYLDGQFIGAANVGATSVATNALPLRIGASQGSLASPSANFRGIIDEVRIYNRALSDAEVATLAGTPVPPTRYTKLSSTGTDLATDATDWACVRDNDTQVVWQARNIASYTHYDDPSKPQKYNGSSYVNPTSGDIVAATNSIGWQNAQNTSTLCGYAEWRLPTQDELLGLVDKTTTATPKINTGYFPDNQAANFWSSTPHPTQANLVGVVHFGTGLADAAQRYNPNGNTYVRLARGGKAPGFDSYPLAVIVSGSQSGSVTSGGINCVLTAGITSGSCLAERGHGSLVTLTATPAAGSSFTGWGGACSGSGSNPTCTLTIDAAKNVSAVFGTPGASRYTKISNLGDDLPDSAVLGSRDNDWACTRDKETGIIWEVKTADNDLRGQNNTYTNYPTYAADTNTLGYVNAVNQTGLCRFGDWDLPTVEQLQTLVNPGYTTPKIDHFYFPNTQNICYWTATPGGSSSEAQCLGFSTGSASSFDRGFTLHALLGSGGGSVIPARPTITLIVPGRGSATIRFTPHEYTGGSSITGFTATCTASGQTPRSANGSASPLTVTGLTGGVSYQCTVTATNSRHFTSDSSLPVEVVPINNQCTVAAKNSRRFTSDSSEPVKVIPVCGGKSNMTPILMLLLD
jgi:hypothetical protein